MTTKPNTITLPGWGDIISIPHGPPPTKAERDEYRKAKREGRPPNLSADRIAEIERRMRIRERIQTSTTPTTAQGWTRILTWLDDAQDLFSIAAFTGRLFFRFAPKTLGRFIPGLGWIFLAADILKLLTLLASLIQPFFVALCHGVFTGIAGALPPLLMGNAAKLAAHGVMGLNPFSRAARLARTSKLTGKLFRFGEMLEMAQAMKTLTGYGLTLGGILGAITETAYGIELNLRGVPTTIQTSGGTKIVTTGQ